MFKISPIDWRRIEAYLFQVLVFLLIGIGIGMWYSKDMVEQNYKQIVTLKCFVYSGQIWQVSPRVDK